MFEAAAAEQDAPAPPAGPQSPASPARRRRSGVHAPPEEGAGEESMDVDVSEDDVPPPPPDPPAPDSEDESDDGDMSVTGEFGPGIVARRRSMSLAGRERRTSRMRSSIAVPPGGADAAEFTVALDRPPPPETDVFRALRAVANGAAERDGEARSDGEADMDMDMDVATAMTRLMAVRDSMGGRPSRGDDSFTSTEDSFDGADAGDRTVNLTHLVDSFHTSDDGDCTAMSVTSDVPPHPTTVPSPSPTRAPPVPTPSVSVPSLPGPGPRQLSVSAFSDANCSRAPAKATAPVALSPAKVIRKATAPVAPPHQPRKRLPGGAAAQTAASPKRRAVAVGGASTQVPVRPAASPSPEKALLNRARRPSGYYRKSLAGVGAPAAEPPVASPARASPRKPASATTTTATASATAPASASAAKPPQFTPRFPSSGPKRDDGHSVREARRSPVPASPVVLTRDGRERVFEQAVPADAVDEDGPEGVDEDEDDAADSQGVVGIDPGEWASTVEGDYVPEDDDMVSSQLRAAAWLSV